MPTTSGTSVKGLQLLGTMPVIAVRFVNIYLPTLDIQNRLDRVGTMLICFDNGIDQRPTTYVAKLYGNGLIIDFKATLPNVALEVWANWFQSGLGFQCTT